MALGRPALAGAGVRLATSAAGQAQESRTGAAAALRPAGAPGLPARLQSIASRARTGTGGPLLDALARLGDRLARESRDRLAAEGCLPAAARRVTVAGTSGWLYPLVNPQGDRFRLFLWFDGAAYQVKVVEPPLGHVADPHACHLLPDARLCLGGDPAGGVPTLEGAFARSALWAAGYGAFTRTGRFPF